MSDTSPTTPLQSCQRCGNQFAPQRSLGLCPNCLMNAIAGEIEPSDHPSLGSIHPMGRCPTVSELDSQIEGLTFSELLGRGGSGWTFLAVQESLARQVAVKIIRRKFAQQDSAQQFRREAEHLAKLNHPGIVTVHDFGVTQDFLYLVMEYVSGPTLRQQISLRTLSVEDTLRIAKEICRAVQSAHEKGILHRDIKPENILFVSDDPASTIKVADFGIAKLINQERDHAATATGFVVGTPYYMAPERGLTQASANAQRSDVYSIGVVVYEMLTGRLPLGRFPPPSALTDCGTSVDAAVFAALENQTENRTATALQFAEQLDKTSHNGSWITPAIGTAATVLTLGVCCWWFFNREAPAVPPQHQPEITATVEAAEKVEEIEEVEENPFFKEWPEEPTDAK